MPSETTTLPAEAFSGTGMQLGERGSVTPESSRAAAWLAARRPDEVDKALLSRISSLNAGLEMVVRDGKPVRVKVTGSMDARREAIGATAGFFAPAPDHVLGAWLAELSVITRRKPDDELTERLRLSAYVSRLAGYPADVAREALLRHKWLFFPAWAELQDVCDALVLPRQAARWHLENAPPPEIEDMRIRPSAKRRAEISACAEEVIRSMGGKNGY